MSQLGWAAGQAIRKCLEDNLDNTRTVSVDKLQSKEYTDFIGSLAKMESLMK